MFFYVAMPAAHHLYVSCTWLHLEVPLYIFYSLFIILLRNSLTLCLQLLVLPLTLPSFNAFSSSSVESPHTSGFAEGNPGPCNSTLSLFLPLLLDTWRCMVRSTTLSWQLKYWNFTQHVATEVTYPLLQGAKLWYVSIINPSQSLSLIAVRRLSFWERVIKYGHQKSIEICPFDVRHLKCLIEDRTNAGRVQGSRHFHRTAEQVLKKSQDNFYYFIHAYGINSEIIAGLYISAAENLRSVCNVLGLKLPCFLQNVENTGFVRSDVCGKKKVIFNFCLLWSPII